MSLNTITNDSNQNTDKLRELIQILQLNGNQRKKQHINFLMDILQIIPFFIKFREEEDEFTQRLFCKYIKYEYYSSSQLVFRTGQQGDSFYIILAGKVGIYAEKNQMINIQDVVNGFNQDKDINQNNHNDIKLIKVLDAGASFGEMALYEDNSQRVSTVFAHTDAFLGVIKREDYLNVIQKKEERARQQTIQNLCNMSLFQGWNMKEISSVAEKMKTIHCKKEEVIYQENQQIQSVFIILSGTFLISQSDEKDEFDDFTITVEDIMKKEKKMKKQNQKLRLLQVHELFGEEELFQSQNKRIHKVVCISDKAKLFQMDIATFENVILNKNQNTKQEVIKRLKVKLDDLMQSQDRELQQANDYQNLASKNYKTILLKFNKDETGYMQNYIQNEKSTRRLGKSENKIKSVCNIQDTQTSRKNTKIVVSRKQMIKKGRYLNQSLNQQQTRQNSLDSITQDSNILMNGYEAEQSYIDQDTLLSNQKNKTTPIKEKNSKINEINSDLPKLYQKVKASIIQQSDNSKNPNSFVLQNPDSFILNFLPSMNKDHTHKMEQIHNQKNQELQENILKKIQRTKTTESSNKIQNDKIDQSNDGVKGSQIFGNFDQLQRKKKIMIEKSLYYRQNEQSEVQQQKLQQIINSSSNNQKQSYPIAVILPNKLYKEEQKRSNSINTISKVEDQQYKQSLKKYLLNQVQQSNRDRVNEMYNTEIQSLEVINNCSDSILMKNNSSFQYNKRLSERQSFSQRTSPKNLQRKRLQPLN
ncbi:hypothetical protein ABPG74_004229 [Tetrahymena malaccensis]